MKVVKSAREFLKIKRKYYKKNSVKRYWNYKGKRRVSYWFDKDFVGYLITTPDQFNNDRINNELILSIGEDYMNNSCNFLITLLEQLSQNPDDGVEINVTNKDNETKSYRFYGYLLTNRDVYYYIFDEEQMQYFLLTFNNIVELK